MTSTYYSHLLDQRQLDIQAYDPYNHVCKVHISYASEIDRARHLLNSQAAPVFRL